jgi:hypothetical protein
MALLIIPFVALSTENQSLKSTNNRGTIFEAEATEFSFVFKQYNNAINSYGRSAELLAVEGGARFPCGLSGPRF